MAEARPDVLAALRACRLWRGASDAALERLASEAAVEVVPRGALLASEGEPADRFAVVVTGRVRVAHVDADGRSLTLETATASEPVAAVAALAGGRYPATVDAATPATVAWLSRESLWRLMADEPEVARAIVTDLAGRVVRLTAVASSLSRDVPERLAAYLFERTLAGGQATEAGLVVGLGMSKGELASALGTVPETLSRAFAKLRDAGIADVRTRDVVVKDVGALARMGSGYSED